ncbi:putative inosine-uridine preferring nucleoside hydrolase [Hibiscus syriacus]|uniref:Inosine-uridine preferring nucleoside hydrolase n=1 Tax=Hibiscus syriacus TaxID=106335 RepID=A0A6A2ZG50_HIBSY|nr:putative inosine-uridine preferring nucleoside hydrolase [Hibiscus syriacus]
MPQGNFETFVSAFAGGSCDNKIVCDTLATTQEQLHTAEESVDVEIPPESFRLSKDAEFHWFDGNAFYERKESHKGNSASNFTNLNPNLNSDSNSQRFPVRTSKASIIGLPKPQKSCFILTKNRKNTKPRNTRLFPKRPGSVKSVSPVEPSSPKVSCMGRVRSRQDPNRSLKKNRQNPDEIESVKEKRTRKRSGCFPSFLAIFRSNGRAPESHTVAVEPSPPRNSDIRSRLPPDDRDAKSMEPGITETAPVGLGGMKHLASGRRSEPLIYLLEKIMSDFEGHSL